MNKHLIFDFAIDKTNKTVIVTREFDAEVDLVWDAFTTKDLLDKWWAPKPWKAKTKTMDFREGGQWIYSMVGPLGDKTWSTTNYLVIKPEKKIIGLDAFTDAEGKVTKHLPQSKREIKFTDKGRHTLVEFKISFDDLDGLDTIIKMGFKEGIAMTMENLDELLIELKK
jgi:uncharacterized protein YndB with AHSA1/START domain